MSVIHIIHHDENIYNLIPKPEKKQTYKSVAAKYQKKTNIVAEERVELKKHQKPCATMGVPQEEPPNPAEYLKRRTGKMAYSTDEAIAVGFHTHEKAPAALDHGFPTRAEERAYVRARYERCLRGANFVRANVRAALALRPRVPERRMVIERFGESKPMTAGLEPIYITQDLVGKAPAYLKRFIKQKEKLRQMQRDMAGVDKPKCKYITREEREKLLTGLKHNWEELQTQYQGLPILTDTIPKKNHKSKLETELRQHEKDIVLVERHPYIYVYDDSVTAN